MAKAKLESLTCKDCGKTLKSPPSFYRHVRTMHGSEVKYMTKFQKKCRECGEHFNNREHLTEHIAEAHKVKVITIKRSFESLKDFEEWKISEETTTGAFYRKSYQYINKAKGFMTSLYVCHRDGKYRQFSTGQRSTKRQGSCKIDATCPSTIKLKMNSKTLKCTIDYIPTHVGHDSDPHHARLHKVQRQLIIEKIKERVPSHQILEEVNNQNPEVQKPLTFKDVHNIKTCFEKEECQLHSDDHISVGLWAERLKEQTLYYNPKGNSDPVQKVDDFVLVFQPLSQRFCSEPQIIWIGTTSDMVYDFHLVSVVAVNSNGEKFPIAQMITSVISENTLTVLYSCIKAKRGAINCSYIMIKNVNFSTPWEKVMEITNYKKILCSWNVSEYWKEHLNFNYEECRNLYKNLFHLLQSEEDVASFETVKEKITSKVNTMLPVMLKLQCQPLILKYFKNKHSWAKCFRLDIHENTDRNLISFENRMAKICFDGKLAGRLDSTLIQLLKFVNETKKYHNAMEMSRRIRKSHRESLVIPDDYVEPVDDYWMVKCPRNIHKIQRGVDEECSCEVRCSECDICEHTLSCSCGGIAICKHIHAVARIFVLNPETIEKPQNEIEAFLITFEDELNEPKQQNELQQQMENFSWTPNQVEIAEIEEQMDIAFLPPQNVDEVEELLRQIENNEDQEQIIPVIPVSETIEKDIITQRKRILERISSISKLCAEKLPQASDETLTKVANNLQSLETLLLAIDIPKSDLERKSEKTSRRKSKHEVRKEESEIEECINFPCIFVE